LIELEILGILPVSPIILFEEASSSETHNSSGVVIDVTRLHNIVTSSTTKDGAIGCEVLSVVWLVVCKLGEVLFAHNQEALI
jgi:hypothetical protein